MGTIRINGFQAPEGVFATIEVFDADGNNGFLLPGTFSQIGYTGNDGDFFNYFVDFDVPFTTTLVNLTLSASNGCVLTYQDVCQNNFPTPTPTDLPPCYAALVESLGGIGNTLNYTDCNGNSTAYTSTAEVNVYLCMPFQQIFDVNFSVDLSTGYDCYSIPDPITGINDWYLPNIPSPTPTPTSVTPTPTPTDVPYIYETMTFTYKFGSTSNVRYYNINFVAQPNYVGLPIYIDVDGAVYNLNISPGANGTNYGFLLSGTTGTITLSALTSTPGVIDSITMWNGFNGVTYGSPQFVGQESYGTITGTTQQLTKLTNAVSIQETGKCFITGDIASLSGNSNLETLWLYTGNFTGSIGDLNTNTKRVRFLGQNTVYGDLSSLSNNIKSLFVAGHNTISGNVSSLTTKFTGVALANDEFVLNGYANITGNCSDLPNVPTIQINKVWPTGALDNVYSTVVTAAGIDLTPTGSTISGVLTLKSYNSKFEIYGANTISGNISAVSNGDFTSNNTTFQIAGYNTISGNIQGVTKWAQQFFVMGNNTIGGDIGQISSTSFSNTLQKITISQIGNYTAPFGGVNLPLPTTSFIVPKRFIDKTVNSGNTITGNISAFATCQNLVSINFGGLNSLNGDLASWAPKASQTPFNNVQIVSSQHTVNTINLPLLSSLSIFKSSVNNTTGLRSGQFLLNLKKDGVNGFTASEINDLLVYLNQTYDGQNGAISGNLDYLESNNGSITLSGTGNATPSGVGLTAKSALESRSYIVATN